MRYQWDFSSVIQYRHVLWEGLIGMAHLALVSVLSAILLGAVIVAARMSKVVPLVGLATLLVAFFRNIPYIVQLFWFFYALPALTQMQATPFYAAFISLTVYGGAYFSEIYRAGINSLDRGQWEAAKAIGMSSTKALRYVILPQAMRRTLPALTTQVIELVKLSTVASSIAYFELLSAGKLIADQELRPIEAYTAVAFILITILMILAFMSSRLEARLARG